MAQILEELQHYVPSRTVTHYIPIEGGVDIRHEDASMYKIILGGDQHPRVRGAQAIRCNGETSSSRLEGVIGVSEDWHAKVTLLQVNIYSNMHKWCIHCDYIVVLIQNIHPQSFSILIYYYCLLSGHMGSIDVS